MQRRGARQLERAQHDEYQRAVGAHIRDNSTGRRLSISCVCSLHLLDMRHEAVESDERERQLAAACP